MKSGFKVDGLFFISSFLISVQAHMIYPKNQINSLLDTESKPSFITLTMNL